MSSIPGIQNNNYANYSGYSYGTGFAISPKPSPSDGEASGETKVENPNIKLQKKMGITECGTCQNRKYQDGSNDPGVSFKTPGHIDPDVSASVVMSHEQEHVRNETAKAKGEDRKVVSQSVRLQTSVCPECGRVYVSGGQTTTVTRSNPEKSGKDYFLDKINDTNSKYFGRSIDIKV